MTIDYPNLVNLTNYYRNFLYFFILFCIFVIFIIMERKTLIISKETHQKLKEYCKNNSIKLNDWVEKLILNEIKKYDGK